LIWHYSVDALYTAFLLLRSPNHYLMVSGAVSAGIMLIPLLVAVVAYWRTGTFTEDESLSNAREGISRPVRKEVAEAEAALVYQPLPQGRLILAGLLTLVFITLAAIPVYRFGEGLSLKITRAQAVRVADGYLRQRQVDPGRYHRVAWVHENVDTMAVRYLLEHKSIKESDQTYRLATRLAVFEVRYFRPLEKEEHHVFLDPTTGQVFGYRRMLDDNAPGASLSSEQAQTLAARYVEEQGYHLSDFDLQSSEAEKRKAREDYTLVWQAKAGDPRNVVDAHYRLEVDVAGDQVVGFGRSFKLPEAWERARRSSSLVNSALSFAGILVGLAFLGAGVVLLVIKIRSGQMPWRLAAKVGALILALLILSELNQWPVFDRQYVTSVPLSTWRLYEVVSLIVVPSLAGLLCWLLVGLAASLYPEAWQLLRGSARRLWRRDAAVCIVLALAAGAGLYKLGELFASRFHALAPVSTQVFSGMFNAVFPGAGFFLGILEWTIVCISVLGVAIYVLRLGWARRAWWLWAGILLGLVAMGPAGAHSLREFFAGWVMNFVPLAVGAAIVLWFFRNNLLAYLGAIFCLQVAQPLVSLLSQQVAFYRSNGLLLALLAFLFLGWLFLVGREGEVRSAP
jgi:hypothetical protein